MFSQKADRIVSAVIGGDASTSEADNNVAAAATSPRQKPAVAVLFPTARSKASPGRKAGGRKRKARESDEEDSDEEDEADFNSDGTESDEEEEEEEEDGREEGEMCDDDEDEEDDDGLAASGRSTGLLSLVSASRLLLAGVADGGEDAPDSGTDSNPFFAGHPVDVTGLVLDV